MRFVVFIIKKHQKTIMQVIIMEKKQKINGSNLSLRKFLMATGIAFIAFFVIAAGAVVGFAFLGNNAATRMISQALGLEVDDEGNIVGGGLAGLLDTDNLPERTNFLLLGTDEAFGGEIGRADMIMIVSLHTETGAMSMISVPRDTHVIMPPDRLQTLRDAGRNTASSSGQMRLNEVTHHSGRALGPGFLARQIEELLDIEIHHYVHLDLEGFRAIVDAIDGIEFDVPRRMQYNDPYQNLRIDLQPGLQLLDGAMAEGLVRYRGYGDADLGRIRVQQEFMQTAASQILDMGNIMANPLDYFRVFMNYMDTDFGLTDLPGYLSLLADLDIAGMQTATLPGHGTTASGRYLHILDEVAAQEIIAQLLHTTPEPAPAHVAEAPDSGSIMAATTSFGMNIEILNGTDIAGLAARASETLTENGYTVINTDNYFGTRQAATRIMVREEGGGRDLTGFFPGSIIIVDASINNDIVIILGTDNQ